jgi:hypothetical protein
MEMADSKNVNIEEGERILKVKKKRFYERYTVWLLRLAGIVVFFLINYIITAPVYYLIDCIRCPDYVDCKKENGFRNNTSIKVIIGKATEDFVITIPCFSHF